MAGPNDMNISDTTIVKLHRPVISRMGDDAFTLMRRGGATYMVTRKLGVETVKLLRRGLTLGQAKQALSSRMDIPVDINLDPLLRSLQKVGLVQTLDGQRVEQGRITVKAWIRHLITLDVLPRLERVGHRCLPISWERPLLYATNTIKQRKTLSKKAREAESNISQFVSSGDGPGLDGFAMRYKNHLIWNIVDFEALWGRSTSEIDRWLAKNTAGAGFEALQGALAMNRGVILCGFHVSSVFLVMLHLMKRGISFTTAGAVNIRFGEARLQAWLDSLHTQLEGYGRVTLAPNADIQSVANIVKLLNSGGIYVTYPDVYYLPVDKDEETRARCEFFRISRTRFPRSQAPIPLLGKMVHMSAWPGWLSSLTGAPIVPIVNLRVAGRRLRLEASEPIIPALSGRTATQRLELNKSAFSVLDRYLRIAPEQWFGWQTIHKLGFEGPPPHETSMAAGSLQESEVTHDVVRGQIPPPGSDHNPIILKERRR
jgi:lauroyl/myristoyl acyltransferase